MFYNEMLDSSVQAQRVLQKYEAYTNAVAKEKTDLTDEQALKLAIMLNNTDSAIDQVARKYEGSTQVADIGLFKKHGLAMISAVMPNLIAEDLVSVQPISQKIAQIFFMRYLYGSNRGNVKAGDVMFDRFASPKMNPNYTSELIEGEEIGTGDNSNTTFEGNLAYIPVRPGTVMINAGSVNCADDGQGKLIGTGVTSGTIDYTSGKFKIVYASAPAESELIEATYDQDLEYAPTQMPEVQLKIDESTVKARPRRLKALYSFESGFELKQQHGIDIDDALLEASVQEIKQEINSEIILDLFRQAGATSTWNQYYNPTTMNISLREHQLGFLSEINRACNTVLDSTKRVSPNYVVVGRDAKIILEDIGAPRYVANGATGTIGAHRCGTIDGRLAVYSDPYLPANSYIIGFKGQTLVDAGYVYAPYLPIFSSSILMQEDFLTRRGFATSYGKKMVNNKLYVRGTITNTKITE